MKLPVLLAPLGVFFLSAMQADDPMLCGGQQREFNRIRNGLTRDQMIYLAEQLRRPCPQLSARIRSMIPPASRPPAERPAPAPPVYAPSKPEPVITYPLPAPRCRPRVIDVRGAQGGEATSSLFQPGNTNCLEAQFGGELQVDVELCGGDPETISGINVENQSVTAEGRHRTWGVRVFYQLASAQGRLSLIQQMDSRGSRYHSARFPPQSARGVRISLPSRRTVGYPIYMRLCSMSFAR